MQNDTVERIIHLIMHALGFLEETDHEGICQNYISERDSDGISLKVQLTPSVGPYDPLSIMHKSTCYSQIR